MGESTAEPADAGAVLVVDDEGVICEVLQGMLGDLVSEVLIATDFGEARKLIESRTIDVGLFDKNLPGGSGIDLAALLRKVDPDAEVIIMTGFSSLESALDAIRINVFDYIKKPFAIREVRQRVVEAIEEVRLRRQRVSRLQHVYRMEALGKLAVSIGHEINNPLTYVLASAEFASERLAALAGRLPESDRSALAEAMSEVLTGGDRIRGIVRDLKVMARVEDEDAVQAVDLDAAIDESIRVVGNSIRHSARLEVRRGSVPAISGSHMRLFQVLVNLLVNAHQSLRPDNADNEIAIETGTDGDGWATISVSDNGCGIHPDVTNRIFDRFFTTKKIGEGTGLGLNISRRYVESMGGRITVQSAPGEGTTFTLHFPPTQPASTISPACSPAPVQADAPASILIIDDDVMLLRSLARILRANDVVTAQSGQEGLDLMVEGGDRFDLALCDVMMPGVDGIGVYEQLSSRRPDLLTRLVFMSGGAFTDRARAFLQAVPNRLMEKPIAPTELRRLVREHKEARDLALAR